MLPSTVERVPLQTAEEVNAAIRRRTQENADRVIAAGPAAIAKRLGDLDREWDIERLLETNAGSAVVVGCVLGATVDRKWFALPAIVSVFLVQHALQGWCPPLPVFRRLGVRTVDEIESERKLLRHSLGEYE
jgi:hypothetical protein